MKFLRVVGFLILGSSLAHANDWTDEQAKKAQAPATPAAPAAKQVPAPVQSAAADDSAAHVVVQGETLWGMADNFYKNPYEWKKIWDANKSQIENPDLIFPDQKFVIPGKTVSAAAKEEPAEEEAEEAAEAPVAAEEKPAVTAKAEEESPAASEEPAEEASVEAQAEPVQEAEEAPPVVVKKTAKSRGALKTGTFLSDKNWEGSGKIVGDQDHKILLGQGDIVYLNIGAANGVKAKMRGTVYRRGRLMRDPDSGDRVGYAINRLGQLEITQEVTDNSATAVIVTSEDPVRVGDFVSLDE